MTHHLALLPTTAEVIPLPRCAEVEHTPLAHHMLTLAAEGRVARSPVLGGWRVTISGRPAGVVVPDQLDLLVEADLVEWRAYDASGDIALATLRGAQLLTIWDRLVNPGGAA